MSTESDCIYAYLLEPTHANFAAGQYGWQRTVIQNAVAGLPRDAILVDHLVDDRERFTYAVVRMMPAGTQTWTTYATFLVVPIANGNVILEWGRYDMRTLSEAAQDMEDRAR